ncbi:hypothetical protein BS47DRAFT_1485107 [Hydnum rufescens UP504]|uniref:Uncharacterized protein n=1 Tax=Hydnum rufescens UP504 TaxID=1448309 RepID=A0A9P6DX71_9AGAM|nr:hypothetical protein BS47DRAFT_1485107 [Hydnum rufescens UP504]
MTYGNVSIEIHIPASLALLTVSALHQTTMGGEVLPASHFLATPREPYELHVSTRQYLPKAYCNIHDMSCPPSHLVLRRYSHERTGKWPNGGPSRRAQTQYRAAPIIRPHPLPSKTRRDFPVKVCPLLIWTLGRLPITRPMDRRHLKQRRRQGPMNVLLLKKTIGRLPTLQRGSFTSCYFDTLWANPHPYCVGSSTSITHAHPHLRSTESYNLIINSPCGGLHGRFRRGSITQCSMLGSGPICTHGDFGRAC